MFRNQVDATTPNGKVKYKMYEKNMWSVGLGPGSPEISIESLKFISDLVRSDHEQRPFPQDLMKHPYFSVKLHEVEPLQSLLVKAEMDFKSFFSTSSQRIQFNTEQPEQFEQFYKQVLQNANKGQPGVEDVEEVKVEKSDELHVSFRPTMHVKEKKHFTVLVFGGKQVGKSLFIKSFTGKEVHKKPDATDTMSMVDTIHSDLYEKTIPGPTPIVFTLMREEHVKFNRATYANAHCAVLILNSASSLDEKRAELLRFYEMITDNCKEGILLSVTINHKNSDE